MTPPADDIASKAIRTKTQALQIERLTILLSVLSRFWNELRATLSSDLGPGCNVVNVGLELQLVDIISVQNDKDLRRMTKRSQS
jgi:hypothetical protein